MIRITLKPGTVSMPAMNALLNAIGTVRDTVCQTFPKVISTTGTPGVSNNTIVATMSASWSHDRLGAIKADVAACALKFLKGINPNVIDFSAERIS